MSPAEVQHDVQQPNEATADEVSCHMEFTVPQLYKLLLCSASDF